MPCCGRIGLFVCAAGFPLTRRSVYNVRDAVCSGYSPSGEYGREAAFRFNSIGQSPVG